MADDLGTSPDDVQFRFRDDEVADHGTVTVDACCEQTNATAVRIEPGDDARVLLPYLDRIALVEVNFPAFGDGRGYSAARILREEGYTGELRAVGEVLRDQLFYLHRCGFNAFALRSDLDAEAALAHLQDFTESYQVAVDQPVPLFRRRA